MATYKCPSLGDCIKANTNELFERSPGEDLKCPQCGVPMELQAIRKPLKKPNPLIIAAASVAVVAALAGGTIAYKKLHAPAETMASASERPAPAAEANLQQAPVGIAAAVPQAASPESQPAKPVGIAPSDTDIKALRTDGDVKLVKGDAAGADLASNRAVAKELLKTAISKMAQGKYDDAEKELNEAKRRDPKESLVYYNSGILRLKQGNIDQALSEFEASFMAGFAYFEQMDEDSDLAALRKDQRFTALVAKYRVAQK